MPKVSREKHEFSARQGRATPYPLPHCDQDVLLGSATLQDDSKKVVKKDWEDAICSVCMECPHNAVLLLCSSHHNGCRPYMCDTSFRHSNCLDQFKKVSSNSNQNSTFSQPAQKSKVPELACPLCRGLVKGWTVVERAREHLNAQVRGCMQDSCSFGGTYRELRKHVRQEHPSAAPRVVDPAVQEQWGRLEQERQQEDVISMVTASLPGSTVVGDYVVEGNNISFEVHIPRGGNGDGGIGDGGGEEEEEYFYTTGVDTDFLNVVFFLNAYVDARAETTTVPPQEETQQVVVDSGATMFPTPGGDFGGFVRELHARNSDGVSLAQRLRRQGRILLGRSERRRRLREATGDGR